MKIINVVGARPNFMKIAPIIEAISRHNRENIGVVPSIQSVLVHTGQHYDKKMSQLFFEDLGIPRPDIELEVGSGSHAGQTAEIMKRFEPILLEEKPDCILVVGDVNSTIACALTASKLGVKIVHVEAGLRSFDRTMPEEINRVLTDALSDILFTTEQSAEENLLAEGISKEKIFCVGNVMIDTLLKHCKKAQASNILSRLGLEEFRHKSQESKPHPYGVLTLHRPSNVDHRDKLNNILEAVSVLSQDLPIVFPIHPRTRKRMDDFGLRRPASGDAGNPTNHRSILFIEPLGYLDFLHLMANARFVLTDSGGMQEETTALGIPCLTLRENTERPVTVTEGTNRVIGTDKNNIINEGLDALNGKVRAGRIPALWDGKAAERIVEVLLKRISTL